MTDPIIPAPNKSITPLIPASTKSPGCPLWSYLLAALIVPNIGTKSKAQFSSSGFLYIASPLLGILLTLVLSDGSIFPPYYCLATPQAVLNLRFKISYSLGLDTKEFPFHSPFLTAILFYLFTGSNVGGVSV